jgi:hypothetical protein
MIKKSQASAVTMIEEAYAFGWSEAILGCVAALKSSKS